MRLPHFYGRWLRRRADALMDADNPVAAWRVYEVGVDQWEYKQDWWMRGVCALIGLGNLELAMAQFSRVNEMRGVPRGRCRVLRGHWAGSIGHMAQLDYLVKLNLLEGGSAKDLILYLPWQQPCPNAFFLSQWFPYLTVVSNPNDLPFPREDAESMEVDLLAPRGRDGKTRYVWEVSADAFRRWEKQQSPPLLSYPQEFANYGWEQLERLGMPRDAWFATLHVRESASNQAHRKLHELRNGRISDYLLAIKAVTDRGGWVVRMGDSFMSPLARMERVIDYPYMASTTDWMDIFLLAHNRFHIGSPSGLSYVPGCYGKPTIFANYWSPQNRPLNSSDLFIPKLWHRQDGTQLPLAESCTDPYRTVLSASGLSGGEYVSYNDYRDITAGVIEMMDRLDGTRKYSAADEMMQRTASVIQETHQCYGNARLAMDWLRKRPEFLQSDAIRVSSSATRPAETRAGTRSNP